MPTKPGRRPLSGYTIKEAAYHEAGHAVLALACQAIVRRATIKPRGALRGRVIFDSHLGPKADLMMLIALAGPPRTATLRAEVRLDCRQRLQQRTKSDLRQREQGVA